MIPRAAPLPGFAVYLLDAGPRRREVVALLQEMTGSSLETCSSMALEVPSLVSLCYTQGEAEGGIARLRKVGALAQLRMAEELVPSPRSAQVPGPAARRPLLLGTTGLAAIQVALGAWWLAAGYTLAGIGGIALGVVVLLGCLLLLRDRGNDSHPPSPDH